MPRGRPRKEEKVGELTKNMLEEAQTNMEIEKQEQLEKEMAEIKERPNQYSPEWSDYAKSFLTKDELQDGYPKTDGLRRIAQLLIGEIVSSKPTPISPPHVNEKGKMGIVTMMWNIVIKTPNGLREFSDISDMSTDNTDKAYFIHPSATCATRAEGRTLRKLLGLKCLSAEEMVTQPKNEDIEFQTMGMINEDQINFLDAICQRLDVNVFSYINMGASHYKTINDVPYDTAKKMCKVLSDWRNDKSLIKECVKGYQDNWREKEF